MAHIPPEIIAGEGIALKIKLALYPNEVWTPKMSFAVGKVMAKFKRLTRKAYPHLDEIAYLHEIGSYTPQDVLDVLGDAKEGTCNDDQPKRFGELMGHSTATR